MGKGSAERGDGIGTFDYFITLMGYAVGLGNLWRFPYLVGKHGGGAFIVAYLICLGLVASPAFLMELVWGNATRKNTMGTFNEMQPRLVGVAWASVVMIGLFLPYYNMLLAYAVVYLWNSFSDPLPWTEDAHTLTDLAYDETPSEHFWSAQVLGSFNPADVVGGKTAGLGGLHGHLVLAAVVVYLIVFFAVFRGLEASAKVTYVTVGLPVACVFVMLIRGLTLPGAGDGIKFYIGKFDIEKLFDSNARALWSDACSQILFSLSPGMGTAVTLSSYTKPSEDVYRINYMVTICNSAFSLICGFVVFSIVGFMSHYRCNTPGLECKEIAELSKAGPGLTFITLAEGLAQFGGSAQFFSVLFFIMILTLGLDSTFATIETMNTYVSDWAAARGRPLAKGVVTGAVCFFFFCVSLLYCTPLGIYLLDVVDHFVATYVMIVVVMVEMVMFRLYWGWERFCANIARATKDDAKFFPDGRQIPKFWKYTILYTAGPITGLIFLNKIVTDMAEPYGGYSAGLLWVGWVCLFASLSMIPLGAYMAGKTRAGATFGESADMPLMDGEMGAIGAAAPPPSTPVVEVDAESMGGSRYNPPGGKNGTRTDDADSAAGSRYHPPGNKEARQEAMLAEPDLQQVESLGDRTPSLEGSVREAL
eukprot:TRINITY_DN2153_c0_g1_i1.p1 TRINITY_DN2153_c0_g1~~TRINITY_DN2153_c0_g1_i1.p1  ORF type:complete len:647 (+),score=228.97 TRINITY_DN2153_c0_g1_i1:91-2031(+)